MSNPLRKTMVYLGLADEEVEYDQHPVAAPAAPAAVAAKRAPVTPLRRPAPARQAAPHDMNEILTVHPRAYKDAQMIA
ncbi:MAG: cell division protein SepF, partial [Microcella sp.]